MKTLIFVIVAVGLVWGWHKKWIQQRLGLPESAQVELVQHPAAVAQPFSPNSALEQYDQRVQDFYARQPSADQVRQTAYDNFARSVNCERGRNNVQEIEKAQAAGGSVIQFDPGPSRVLKPDEVPGALADSRRVVRDNCR